MTASVCWPSNWQWQHYRLLSLCVCVCVTVCGTIMAKTMQQLSWRDANEQRQAADQRIQKRRSLPTKPSQQRKCKFGWQNLKKEEQQQSWWNDNSAAIAYVIVFRLFVVRFGFFKGQNAMRRSVERPIHCVVRWSLIAGSCVRVCVCVSVHNIRKKHVRSIIRSALWRLLNPSSTFR